jgi:Na+-transporting NADH:ubiquinone oxidoreductase subunit NqrD
MDKNSPSKNWPLIVGLILLVLGTGPLVFVMVAAKLGFGNDPNPNPIIHGMLAGLTFYPSLGLVIWGLYRIRTNKKTFK